MQNKPKKSLGQNFLVDKNILQKIIKIGDINTDDHILEIGPGTGNLTKLLVKSNVKKITVIEKDNELSDNLKIKDVPIRFDRRISGKSKMSFSILTILVYFIFIKYINKIVYK